MFSIHNVPGAYSSAGGGDFWEVLRQIVQIRDESLSVPMPEKRKWLSAGEIMGDGFSLAWRTLDAQFWGVAQRRRRCYLVADFNGESAGRVLFEFEGVSGYTPQGFGTGQGAAADAKGCAGEAGTAVLNDQGGSCMDISEDVIGTLRAEAHGHQPLVFEPGAVSRIGGHCWENTSGTLRADMGDNQLSAVIPINTQVATRHKALGEGTGFGVGEDGDPAYTLQAAHSHAVAVENHPADSRVQLDESGTVQTLTSRMGTGGGNVPLVMNEPVPQTLKIRSGCEGGGKGALVQDNKSATLSCNNDQTVFVPKAYGICSDGSNAMQSDNPHSGVYEADTSRTLDGNGGNPSCNQGGIAVVALQGSMIGREDKNGPQGSGVSEDVCFTLNTVDKHSVAYSLDRAAYNQGQNAQYDISISEEQAQTLVARGPHAVAEPSALYTVRRLTPQECALLQGFLPNWCDNLETSEPSEEDILWWSEVFETHRKAMGKTTKPKSRNQVIKWLKSPHSDSAEYKLWGNGVALPCVRFVMSGIVWASGL